MNALQLTVGILAILTTVLIGWQIINYLTFERRMRKRLNKAISEQMQVFREYVDKRTYGAKYNLLVAIMTSLISSEDWDSIVLISTYLPETLLGFNASSQDIDNAIELMKKAHETESRRASIHVETTEKLRERLVPLLNHSSQALDFYTDLSRYL